MNSLNLSIGDRLDIPADAVSPCLHAVLDDAEVVGFREDAINGRVIVLKTSAPWSARPGWPKNSTIGISEKQLHHFSK